MKRLIHLTTLFIVLVGLLAFIPPQQTTADTGTVRLNMKFYGNHDESSYSTTLGTVLNDTRILYIKPQYLIDNPVHGHYGERYGYGETWLLKPSTIAKFQAAGIKVIGYITSGYEGGKGDDTPGDLGGDFPNLSWYSLDLLKKMVYNMATIDKVNGVFVDECSQNPIVAGTADYHRQLVSYIHSLGLIAWGNTGLDQFNGNFYFNDAKYDFMQSSESWTGQPLSNTQTNYGSKISVTGFNRNYTAQTAYLLTLNAWNKGLAFAYINNVEYTSISPWFEEYANLLRGSSILLPPNNPPPVIAPTPPPSYSPPPTTQPPTRYHAWWHHRNHHHHMFHWRICR